jgi:hypothetical protein
VKVTHKRVEEKAPPGVAGFETDADYRYDAFSFDFGEERYHARIFDSDRASADVMKKTSGPDNDACLVAIKEYLVNHAGVSIIETIDPKTGAVPEWPR